MKCFYHQDRDAVGSCKSCGKGLCAECAIDLGKGLACRDRCEEEVEAVIALVAENIRMLGKSPALLQTSRRSYLWTGAYSIVIGAVFLAWGLSTEPRLDFVVVIGGVGLAFGLLTIVRAFGMPRANDASLAAQKEPAMKLDKSSMRNEPR
jgi:hypothetical protein